MHPFYQGGFSERRGKNLPGFGTQTTRATLEEYDNVTRKRPMLYIESKHFLRNASQAIKMNPDDVGFVLLPTLSRLQYTVK